MVGAIISMAMGTLGGGEIERAIELVNKAVRARQKCLQADVGCIEYVPRWTCGQEPYC